MKVLGKITQVLPDTRKSSKPNPRFGAESLVSNWLRTQDSGWGFSVLSSSEPERHAHPFEHPQHRDDADPEDPPSPAAAPSGTLNAGIPALASFTFALSGANATITAGQLMNRVGKI